VGQYDVPITWKNKKHFATPMGKSFVKQAEYLLQGHGQAAVQRVLGYRPTYEGDRDGIPGPKFFNACKNMKWAIGYKEGECYPTFGQDLYDLLVGKKRQTLLMRRRAKSRTAPRPTRAYPLAKRGVVIGFPGIGTHSYYGTPNNWQSDHAYDIEVPVGTSVHATEDGTICSSCGFGLLEGGGGRFAGKRFTLVGESGCQYYYAHLTELDVVKGQKVEAGEHLGFTGEANNVPHLHIGCSYNYDPKKFILAGNVVTEARTTLRRFMGETTPACNVKVCSAGKTQEEI
jgi:murein DD-endopeptidase MepM/ murein hydrolase activator NlpD